MISGVQEPVSGQSLYLISYFGVSPTEMLLVMLVALLLYGGELPKVARSWGKSLAEFKKGMSGIQNEFNSVFYDEPRRIPYHDPVYSHNAGTVDGHLSETETATATETADGTRVHTAAAASSATADQQTTIEPAVTERESI